MAGDWIKMEVCTPEKAEVLAITARMGWDDTDVTVGKLFRLWRWFDQQTSDGNAHGVTSALLDRIVGVTGFCEALAKVGWLTIHSDGISLPNFDRHNGNTAKNRAQTAKRVAKHKSNAKANASGNADTVTTALPREEKRREDSVSSLRSETHTARDAKGNDDRVTRPTPAAAVCFAIRSAGIAQVNPAHPELLALLEQGADISHFVEAAKIAKDKGKSFAYVLGIVKGQIADGQAAAEAAQARPPKRQPHQPQETFRERDERLAREKMAAFLPGIAARAPQQPSVIDVTPINTPELSNGIPHQLGR